VENTVEIAGGNQSSEFLVVEDISSDELEGRIVFELAKILPTPQRQIVDGDDVMAKCDESVAKMASDETGTPRD
jgi:hypothetical protein